MSRQGNNLCGAGDHGVNDNGQRRATENGALYQRLWKPSRGCLLEFFLVALPPRTAPLPKVDPHHLSLACCTASRTIVTAVVTISSTMQAIRRRMWMSGVVDLSPLIRGELGNDVRGEFKAPDPIGPDSLTAPPALACVKASNGPVEGHVGREDGRKDLELVIVDMRLRE
jgi:hypothetical protein